ncbi:OLC1v1037489C1 [Oldenlandia corymbosa var. corymbosa]|uniref:OLC1v1037489C1 n=1 Tax=Oldenlandia corymbosa var. corymbosa TaxID=529605 RepID=A0AAV1E524_OLDCO|nr:OLC1v1037489C1 [Oldenlandia corymbosa var. corymbosa]
MWNNLPCDLLAHIFSFLPPDSLACAKSTCRNWHECPDYLQLPESGQWWGRRNPAWFMAVPNRNRVSICYAQNPVNSRCYILSLDFIPTHIRPVSPIGGLILFRPISTTALQLAVCNPFTRQIRHLPTLNVARTNPAVGTIDELPSISIPGSQFQYRVYVVGGMSDAPSGGATYEPTIEMYDSRTDSWAIIGSVPIEYAVRLTVWTPNESVFCNGTLYWMTSARAYSVMGFEIATGKWKELSVPLADRLEFAALVRRNGKLTVLGGKCGGDAYVWELGEGEVWGVVEKVPFELGMKFLGGKGCWDNTRCVGNDGMVCLYKDLGSGMLGWREVDNGGGRWDWFWIDGGCFTIRGHQLQNLQIKGLLLYPNLSRSGLFSSSLNRLCNLG